MKKQKQNVKWLLPILIGLLVMLNAGGCQKPSVIYAAESDRVKVSATDPNKVTVDKRYLIKLLNAFDWSIQHGYQE